MNAKTRHPEAVARAEASGRNTFHMRLNLNQLNAHIDTETNSVIIEAIALPQRLVDEFRILTTQMQVSPRDSDDLLETITKLSVMATIKDALMMMAAIVIIFITVVPFVTLWYFMARTDGNETHVEALYSVVKVLCMIGFAILVISAISIG